MTRFRAVRDPVLIAVTGVAVLLAGCSQGASPAEVATAAKVAAQEQAHKDAIKQEQEVQASLDAHAKTLKDEAAKATAAKAATARAAAAKATAIQTATPTLGQMAGTFGMAGHGFGLVKPSEVFNGGDPTGLITKVVWDSWGGPRAVGHGFSIYVGPNQTVADGTMQPSTIVAFKLGTCDGKLMYQAVEWYFPQHGGIFEPTAYEDICTGSYVPNS